MAQREEPTVDLRINRFSRHAMTSILKTINKIPRECFNFPMDVYSMLDKCLREGLTVNIQNMAYVWNMRDDQRKQYMALLMILMKHNTIDDIYNVLTKSSIGCIKLAFQIKRHDPHNNLNQQYACNPDEDMQNVERKLQEYIRSHHTAFRKIRLLELVRFCINNLNRMANRELQEEINLLAVATRQFAQISDTHAETNDIIHEMWAAVQAVSDPGVSTFYAELVYHGREIITKAERGDLNSVREYVQELENLCLKYTHHSIMPLFYQRKVYVLRTAHKATQRPELLTEALQQCKQGYHFATVLSERMRSKYKLFFRLDEVQLLLRINPDYTCQQIVPPYETLRTVSEKMDALERRFMAIMSTGELLAYNVCRARLNEFENIPKALHYVDKALRICEPGVFAAYIGDHINNYKDQLVHIMLMEHRFLPALF